MDDNDFFTVAMAARNRGFAVTPLRDTRPFLHAWNRHPLTTETEIRTAAKEYPTCDVGLVMKRGVGEPFAIDIDSPGVIERLERETHMTLPATYTVLSRPRRHRTNGISSFGTLSTPARYSARMSTPASTT